MGLAYTKHINEKYARSGSLFQGTFKAKHISTNDYLQYVSAYINLNDKVHQIEGGALKLVRSSWQEYIENKKLVCDKKIILGQFGPVKKYERYCMDSLPLLREQKELSKELRNLGFEE